MKYVYTRIQPACNLSCYQSVSFLIIALSDVLFIQKFGFEGKND